MDIHQPVKVFTKHLINPVNRLFASMKPDNLVWRANWSIFDDLKSSLDLFTPEEPIFDREMETELFLRVERQTLRRLPESQAILFTIRTYQRPFSELKEFPQVAKILAERIRNMHPDVVEYKSSVLGITWFDRAIEDLENISNKT